jgi:hypothetical protein
MTRRISYLGGLVLAAGGLLAALTAGQLVRPALSDAAADQEAEIVLTARGGVPVQFEARVFYPATTPVIHVVTAYEVPDGKRLVVEHVSGSIILASQERMRVRVQGHFLPFQLDPHAASGSPQRATASEPMTFVVDDRGSNAAELKIELLREGSSLPFTVNQLFYFSGYLYDRPA